MLRASFPLSMLICAAALIGCIDRRDRLPIVIVDLPANVQGGVVEIGVTLRDQNTSGLHIAVDYRDPETLQPLRATLLPGSADTNNIIATPGGIRHVFLWDALADLGAGRFASQLVTFSLDNGSRASAIVEVRNVDMFAPVGALDGHRETHAGAELRDGRVLLCGGRDAQGTLLSGALLYEVSTDTFSVTSALAEARANHTVTTLQDGRVLVVGGEGTSGVLASAELYDPSTESFSGTGSLATARQRHRATLLADGRVLITGGEGAGGGALGAAELYDPSNGGFSPAGSHIAREGHRATLLQNGNVLLSGGRAASSLVSTAEIFVPNSGFVSVTASPLRLRREHTATMLFDGRVLLAGGLGVADSTLASVELFVPDNSLPAAGTFEQVVDRAGNATTLLQKRARHGAALTPDSLVVLFGGSDGVQQLSAAEVYSPQAGSFTETTQPLRNPRARPVGIPLRSGRILITGDDASAVLYHPRIAGGDETFDVQPGAIHPRTATQAVAFGSGRVLICGGRDRDGVTDRAEMFDFQSQRFLVVGPLQSPRIGHAMLALRDGRVLVYGGSDGSQPLASAELFDPVSLEFEQLTTLSPRQNTRLVQLTDGDVLIVGGEDSGGALASAELFTPGTETFSTTGSMAEARTGHSATILATTQAVIIGGQNATGFLATAELYDSRDGTFGPAGETLEVARAGFVAVDRPPNWVFVVGGVSDTGAVSLVEQYDGARDNFARVDFDIIPRANPQGFRLTLGDIVIFGGEGEAATRGSLYRIRSNTIHETADPFLAVPRFEYSAARISLNLVLLYGGRSADGSLIGGAEVFTQDDLINN